MISVIILTLNEEADLPGCLDSLRWCDDVHVVDSLSIDRTREIARNGGATVLENEFESFGKQRNWALDHCPARHDWILFLDADERVTPEMVEAMRRVISEYEPDVAGFYCCWKLILNGRWLKRSDNFPKWQFRLLRKGRARFCDFGHGQKEAEIQGRIAYLREPYLHFAFSRGWGYWHSRHRDYARKEAVARRSGRINLRALFSKDSSLRNPAIKIVVSRLPGWPQLRFFYSYVLRGGFLEGYEALVYCRKMMWYEAEIQRAMRCLNANQA